MLFNSLEFFVFFAIVYALYRPLGMRGQNRLLLLSSYIFYGWWDVRFLYLVVLSTGLDYCCGLILGPGKIPLKDRLVVSTLLILAAVVFVGLAWGDAVHFARGGGTAAAEASSTAPNWGLTSAGVSIDWARLLEGTVMGRWVVAITVLAVAIANLIYFPLSRMDEANRRRIGLALTITANIGLLACFKYFNFFVDSADQLLGALGLSASTFHLHIILPAGISFYTFQSLSYTIDVYKRKTPAIHSLEDYALFVMFFPVLVAGPIERAGHMVPKLTTPRVLTLDQTTRGLFLVLIGLFKKVAIADGLAPSVSSVFDTSGQMHRIDIVAASVLFAVQIYCDFSGYTDIARGVGKILGIDLLLNFNLPYFSRGPSEFWQRWHISLSTWLRDYLYIPLGGNRLGESKTYRNLMITMILGGLWHGAAWNFVLWGFYQGAILCLYRLVLGDRKADPHPFRSHPLRSILSLAVFFSITCYGWLLFRAGSFGQIATFTRVLLTENGPLSLSMARPTLSALAGLLILAVFELMEYRAGDRQYYRSWPRPIRGALYAVMIFILSMGLSNAPAQFIYFQF